ncbi:MAG: hypothetical protein J6A21_06410 [Lentisphaeria bacterium]|nr:hypothetical protein [Lentisphaeria bacterium]
MDFVSANTLRTALQNILEELEDENDQPLFQEVRQLYGDNADVELFLRLPDLAKFPAAAIQFLRTRTPTEYGGAVQEIDGNVLVICRTNGVPEHHEEAETLFETVLSTLRSDVPGQFLCLRGCPLILLGHDAVSAGLDYAVSKIEFTLKVPGRAV